MSPITVVSQLTIRTDVGVPNQQLQRPGCWTASAALASALIN